jgi:uncharacterized protein
MKNRLTSLALLLTLTFSSQALELNTIPKTVVLDGDNGGKVTDESFSTAEIKDKVFIMFYVDPDEKDTNEEFSQALKAESFDRSKFASLAVINLAATWKPNFVIESILKSKQEEFPHTIYAKDKESVFVKEWDLEDDNSDILVFNQKGEVIFYHAGKVDEKMTQDVIALIKSNL